MAKTVSMVGIDPDELDWIRRLLFLLRHPDPLVSELARQAIQYLTERSAGPGPSEPTQKNRGTERHLFEKNLVS